MRTGKGLFNLFGIRMNIEHAEHIIQKFLVILTISKFNIIYFPANFCKFIMLGPKLFHIFFHNGFHFIV